MTINFKAKLTNIILKINTIHIFSVFLITELLCYLIKAPMNNFNMIAFCGSSLLTIILFEFLTTLISFCNKFFRSVFAIILGLVFSILILVSVVVYTQFAEFVTSFKFQFFINNLDYSLAFAKAFLFNWYVLIFIPLWGLLTFLFYKAAINKDNSRKSIIKSIALLIIYIIVYLVILNQFVFYTKNMILDITTSMTTSAKMVKKYTGGNFFVSDREPLTKFQPSIKQNVILIINESFGKSAFNNNDSTWMPLLKNRLKKYSNTSYSFDNAFTNSNSTDISVSSILSGVAPQESNSKLHSMPLIWQWFKSGGYATALLSAQKYSWSGLNKFSNPRPDIYLTADEINQPLLNDGIDEGYMCNQVIKTLKELENKKPFFLIYNTNALHNPFLQQSKCLAIKPNFSSKLKNASTILDKVLDSIFTYLESEQLFENSIIIITADHGETEKPIHNQNRIFSFFDEIQNIPFFIFLPEVIDKQYRNNLLINKKQIVGNLDILPTLIQLIGAVSNNQQLYNKLSGKSILNPISNERYMISLNTNDVRQCEHEGFGIFFKNKRFFYTDIEGSSYYNNSTDSTELKNLWSNTNDSERTNIYNIIKSNFQLRRMFPNK